MADLMFKDEVYAVQGAIFEVYKAMGNMWAEEVYQQCLELELEARNIPFSVVRQNRARM